jgi:hypothetical protein
VQRTAVPGQLQLIAYSLPPPACCPPSSVIGPPNRGLADGVRGKVEWRDNLVAACYAVNNRRIRRPGRAGERGNRKLGLIRPKGRTGYLGSEPVS